MGDYKTTIDLKHSEVAAIVDKDTGEFRAVVASKTRKEPKDISMTYFDSSQPYSRRFNRAWLLLETQTTVLEFRVANKLSLLAEAYTNSLEPMSPESTSKELSLSLGIDRRVVESVIDKLFKLGVIGKFEVYDRYQKHHKYWLFNPHLSFNGKVIKRDVITLFDKTFYASA